MDFWKIIISIFLFSSIHAQVVQSLDVRCSGSERCEEIVTKSYSIIVPPLSLENFRGNLDFLLFDSSIKSLHYRLNKEGSAIVTLELKNKIRSIDVIIDGIDDIERESLLNLLPLKENTFINESLVLDTKTFIEDYLRNRGYLVSKIELIKEKSGQSDVDVVFKANIKSKVTIKKIAITCDYQSFINDINYMFLDLRKKGLNTILIKARIQEILNEYSRQGFFYAKANFSFDDTKSETTLELDFNLGEQFQFDFMGARILDRSQLINMVSQEVRKKEKIIDSKDLGSYVRNLYEENGVYGTHVSTRISSGVNKFGVKYNSFFVIINEGQKIPVNKILYNGIFALSLSDIENLFSKTSTPLASRNFLDKKFFVRFSNLIKKEYLKNGFIFAEVSEPVFDEQPDKSINVVYNIAEKRQNILEKINILNTPTELKSEMINLMSNKEGKPLNVLELEKDFSAILDLAKTKGYFFSEIRNLKEKSIITYSSTYDTSQINIDFNLGKKSLFGSSLVSGNRQTRDEVIEREVLFKKGDLVTLKVIQDIRNRLNSLGLFSSVKITPFVADSTLETNTINLLVEVVEKPFGSGEFAPGYRTDLGPKASLSVGYNNLFGLNHVVSGRLQANQRINSTGLDARRKSEDNQRLEFLAEFKYKIPYWLYGIAFDSQWELEMEASFRRARFFNFDADIWRVSPRLSKKFTNSIFASLKYQFESIRQYDATELKDDDRFRIGGLTPSLTFDFRDDAINPTKGAYFGLSWEFANPYFGSQEGSPLEINYSKLISRNRFYYPLGNWIMALSISGGYQRNYANDVVFDETGNPVLNDDGVSQTIGYIPSIKVFRLNGLDNVRGYADSEINRLEDGQDISDLRIQDEAYFVNYKFEPRYKVNDTLMLSVFFDAGAVFFNNFSPLSVRTAVGSGFKVLTPVGSLDFDYGVKLKRRSFQNGNIKEAFGRFHLTIGSF